VAENRNVILVQPDGTFLAFPAPAQGAMPPEKFAQIESIVAATPKRNISAIAATALVTGQPRPLAIATEEMFLAAGKAIPFFGLLVGLAYIGHTVRVFDGTTPPLAIGCKDADVLIIDSAQRANLREDWLAIALPAMRNANVFVHDRATYQLRIIHKVGDAKDRIEFK
jgi:hypothetical protein